MWCTRWFLPLLLLPLPTAPPYFLVLFLLTLALHARPCFYCIILLAALFLSSCYWQSFPLNANLSVPWAHNVTTFSEALSATMSPHLSALEVVPPVVRVADRCWCDFASGLFEPYDVQKWERESVQRAIAQIEKQWKQTSEADTDTSSNATSVAESVQLEPQQTSTSPNLQSIRKDSFFSIFYSLFSRRSNNPSVSSTPPTVPVAPNETPTKTSPVDSLIPADQLLAPGQLDLRPLGFEIIFDFRWSRRS